MRRPGNTSSKYDFSPENLEKDISNKCDIVDRIYEDIFQMLDSWLRMSIKYNDGIPVSLNQRWIVLIEAVKEIKEKYDIKII